MRRVVAAALVGVLLAGVAVQAQDAEILALCDVWEWFLSEGTSLLESCTDRNANWWEWLFGIVPSECRDLADAVNESRNWLFELGCWTKVM